MAQFSWRGKFSSTVSPGGPVGFRGVNTDSGVSTDPGREGDPALLAETPAQTRLLNERASLDAQAAQDAANAAAERARGAANANEADAYRIAAGTAGSNADLEMQSAALQALQQARQVRTTIGAQRADVATSGFREAGTNLSLLRDSMAQGAITDALTRLNGNIAAAGYRGQQTAAQAEEVAAEGNSQAAQILAQQYADAGVLATSQSANLAAAFAANPDPQASTLGFTSRTAAAGGGGVTGFSSRPTRSDPFLEGTLTNPAYNPNATLGPDASGVGGETVPSTSSTGAHVLDSTGRTVTEMSNIGSGTGTGTGGESIGPAGTPSWIDPAIEVEY